MVIEIPNARLPSYNKFYAGISHWERTTLKDTWTALVRAYIPADAVMFQVPVDIWVMGFYKGNVPDSDNVCAKLAIDGLKDRVIVDDSHKYVHYVTTLAKPFHENIVVIEIDPAD